MLLANGFAHLPSSFAVISFAVKGTMARHTFFSGAVTNSQSSWLLCLTCRLFKLFILFLMPTWLGVSLCVAVEFYICHPSFRCVEFWLLSSAISSFYFILTTEIPSPRVHSVMLLLPYFVDPWEISLATNQDKRDVTDKKTAVNSFDVCFLRNSWTDIL